MNNDLMWKPIDGWPYSVSNKGDVRNNRTGHIKSVTINKNGYAQVHLFNDGKVWFPLVHRLVAAAFIPNDQNNAQVNHIDGNKANNTVENLEWVTNGQNQKHKYDVLGYKKETWSIESAVAVTRRKVVCIETGKEYKSLAAAAMDVGGYASALCNHLKGKSKSFAGLHWRYCND